jgi:hypothetical protein
MAIPEYSEYDVETTTHLTRAVKEKVEARVREAIKQSKTPTAAQVENWVQQEWEKAKQAVKHWGEVHRQQVEMVKSLKVSDRVLRRIRDDNPGVSDTLDISAYSKDWKRVREEEST